MLRIFALPTRQVYSCKTLFSTFSVLLFIDSKIVENSKKVERGGILVGSSEGIFLVKESQI